MLGFRRSPLPLSQLRVNLLLALLPAACSGALAGQASPAWVLRHAIAWQQAAQQGFVQQDIFTTAPFASCHASTLVELHDGSLLAAWFGGSGEGQPDVAIWGARRTAQGWSAPFEIVREPDIASWNPVLFHDARGRLWLYYKFGPVAAGWTGARMVSGDEGRTWSKPKHLPAGLLGPIRAKPYLAPDGTVVAGSSTESYHAWAVWIERSTSADPEGAWQRLGPYTLPDAVIASLKLAAPPSLSEPGHSPQGQPKSGEPSIGELSPAITTGLIQPTVLSLGGPHLRFYARSTSNIGRICVSDSYDEGRTWTAPRPLDVPNPNSGIDLVALRDGRIVLIYNDTTTGRTPLNLAVSRDGEHFTNFRTLEDEPGEYSYPAIIQAKDGSLLATYTWQRKRIRFVRVPLESVP
jgi:predicted neuraminidase